MQQCIKNLTAYCLTKVMVLSVAIIISSNLNAQQITKTDAEPDYWTNLYNTTIRYTIMQEGNSFDLDLYFGRNGNLKSNNEYQGKWWVKGVEGSQLFCYEINSDLRDPSFLSECFPLILMNNPRIGATWFARFDQGIMYEATVVAGRDSE
tara:strand:- start:356 stop:805 length:450 start_codon:yes stop_codon:yes gene_type:complete